MSASPPTHRYFLAWPTVASGVRELSGPEDPQAGVPDARYALAVLAAASPLLADQTLHFYLTKDTSQLPEYGPHVVAVLLLEERCKFPTYARDVRAVLRNMASRPYLGFRPHLRMGKLETVELFEYTRDWFLHLRSRSRMRTGASAIDRPPLIHRIPLGYQSQLVVPQRAMADRTLDMFFAGDVASPFQRSDYRYWIPPSKTVTRRQLWRVLRELQATGDWRIQLNDVRPDEPEAAAALYQSYSERMMNSRICVAPRGSNAESYRFYEGLRAGCLVLTSPFPDEPFLRSAPVIVVDDWRQLPALLRRYARNLDALEQYRAAGIRWWNEYCSEPVIAAEVAAVLRNPVE